jgi:hypothetical protein
MVAIRVIGCNRESMIAFASHWMLLKCGYGNSMAAGSWWLIKSMVAIGVIGCNRESMIAFASHWMLLKGCYGNSVVAGSWLLKIVNGCSYSHWLL